MARIQLGLSLDTAAVVQRGLVDTVALLVVALAGIAVVALAAEADYYRPCYLTSASHALRYQCCIYLRPSAIQSYYHVLKRLL